MRGSAVLSWREEGAEVKWEYEKEDFPQRTKKMEDFQPEPSFH